MYTIITPSALTSTLWGQQRNGSSPPYFRWGSWSGGVRTVTRFQQVRPAPSPLYRCPPTTLLDESWFFTPLAKLGLPHTPNAEMSLLDLTQNKFWYLKPRHISRSKSHGKGIWAVRILLRYKSSLPAQVLLFERWLATHIKVICERNMRNGGQLHFGDLSLQPSLFSWKHVTWKH